MATSLAHVNDHGRLEMALNKLDGVKRANTDPRVTLTADEMTNLTKAIKLLEPIESRLWRMAN